MVHTPRVLARRNHHEPRGTVHLTDGASSALQLGHVDQALRIYRELERLEDENPTWSLRVAECYRRLAQRDGEVSALMRAANRYEQRGFVREALALWKRVQVANPKHPSSQLALERLEPSRGLGLERLRSSMPPALQYPPSRITSLLGRDTAVEPAPVQEFPPDPRVPVIEDEPVGADARDGAPVFELPSIEAEAELDIPVFASDLDESPPPLDVPVTFEDFAEPEPPLEAAPADALPEADEPDPSFAVELATFLLPTECAPPTARVSYEPAPARQEPETVASPSVVSAVPDLVGPRLEPHATIAVESASVRISRVVPVVAEPPALPRVAPILPLPIFSVGGDTEAEAEVEFLEAEVLPCLDEIDYDW